MHWLRKIAYPVSLVYGLVVHIRNLLYDIGFFESRSFRTPTICIGNLSVGGTGKTPMIEYFIRELQHDYKLAVLSRGYKRKSKGFQLANETSSVEDLGDEPFQLFSKHNISLAVDADRCNGIKNLEEQLAPELILLDDAFQHRKIKPSFNVLLTAYSKLYVDDTFLPTGNLRDSKNQVERADVVVVTKCPRTIDEKKMDEVKTHLNCGKPVLFASLSYDGVLKSETGELGFSDVSGNRVALVTAIADPQPLVHHLESLNVDFKHFDFSDHHFFSEKELQSFRKYDYIITTEKDHTRLNGKVERLYYLGMKHEFLDGGSIKLLKALEHTLKHRH